MSDALEDKAAALAARLQGLKAQVATLQAPPRVMAAAAAAPNTLVEVPGGMAAAAAGQVVTYSPPHGMCMCYTLQVALRWT